MTEQPPLCVKDFPEVLESIHDHWPYAWQERLLANVASGAEWPAAIAAPTGAGKTAVLDIALFHLALEAGQRERRAPMRIVLAVDRRIIVDQAFERARRIRGRLENATDGTVLGRMAERLRSYSGHKPVHIAELRGGMPLEQDWARRPDQPTILCTTVDQLGSRLLFRGYGVSSSMAPVHAGLLGCDALLILDEAHLSRAFEETLAEIGCARRAEPALKLPWGWTALTATPRADSENTFRLTDKERAEPQIARRLTASKKIELRKALLDPTAFANAARQLRDNLRERGETAPVIAVVVNRVPLAREVFEQFHDEEDADAILLTGRVRPLERDNLIETWRDRLEGKHCDAVRPLYVVATQCIEAGADFDFDAMVSQIAPLDALRQRFGRLARSGNRGDHPAHGLVLATQEEIGKRANDPIYGRAPAETWAWLESAAETEGRRKIIDFGPDALDRTLAAKPPQEACLSPAPSAPPLREADLQALAMTGPKPFPDPIPAMFMHGELRDEAEIALVWRGDIADLETRATDGDREALAGLDELLTLLPPRPAEALRLPLWVARMWLAGGEAAPDDALADIPVTEAADADVVPGRKAPVLRWRGKGDLVPVAPSQLRPGDVVVLPSARGGCDAFGWAPDFKGNVCDLADAAARPFAGRRAALRLHRAVWPEHAAPWPEIAELLEAVASAMEIARACGLPEWEAASGLTIAQPYGDDPSAGAVLIAPKGLAGMGEGPAIPSTEGDEGLFAPEPVSLEDHAAAVGAFARRHAEALGLSPDIAHALAQAGCFHDHGKADPRFQSWLRSIEGLPDERKPIAKTTVRASPSRQKELRRAAGLPDRWRHEVASVRILAHQLSCMASSHKDLRLWLVGTHHGHGRPFFPHDDNWDEYDIDILGIRVPAGPGPDKLDFDWEGKDWARLMDRLHERYGYWGLAFLEACLRLADHRASAGEVP